MKKINHAKVKKYITELEYILECVPEYGKYITYLKKIKEGIRKQKEQKKADNGSSERK